MEILHKIIDKWKFKKLLSNSIKRYRIETKINTAYVDPQDKEDMYYIYHVFIGRRDVKIIAEMLDGTEMQVILGKRRRTKKDD